MFLVNCYDSVANCYDGVAYRYDGNSVSVFRTQLKKLFEKI